ncbi:hypothetical protein [Candidatus Odyssella acanthamoebae]|uniref:F-box/LRR-repeat protein 15-like leucin rich repeat domain-containing protein n=1 Tax=Candidatus Odyssella acanthamoebae TaxID=91604 RepID=A0A077AY38_9PROT|nr:hypothetical protein [Candidatus Paracaedibacter acanthamoebae]AIK96558.1 hypothetical protein ID47_07135 [Candidatus Paracaedibacter acanthamoebae]
MYLRRLMLLVYSVFAFHCFASDSESEDEEEIAWRSLLRVISNDASSLGGHITLTDIEIDEKRAQELADALDTNKSLISLGLQNTAMNDDVLKVLLPSLMTRPTLTRLNLSGNDLSDESAPLIFRLLTKAKSLSSISLEDNGFTDNGVGFTLDEWITQDPGTLMGAFASSPILRLIHLKGNNLSSEAFAAIEEFIQERGRILLHERAVRSSSSIDNVITPELHALLTREPVPAIKEWLQDPRIAKFDRDRKALGNKEFIKRLKRVCLGLAGLSPEIQNLLTLEGLLGLALNSDLVTSYDPVYKRTTLDDSATGLLAEVLHNNKALRGLYLQGVSLHGSLNFPLLSGALLTLTSLETLELLNNNLGDAGALLISQFLIGNPTLTYLGLANNKIKAKGIDALADALAQNTVLKTLILASNPIGDQGGIKLADVLTKNKSLSTLDLAKTLLGEEGAIALAECLEVHPELVLLGLFGNQIGDNGLAAFVEGIKKLERTIEILLDHNPICPEDLELFKTNQAANLASYALHTSTQLLAKYNVEESSFTQKLRQEGFMEPVPHNDPEEEEEEINPVNLTDVDPEAELEVSRVAPREKTSQNTQTKSFFDRIWGRTSSSSIPSTPTQPVRSISPALLKDPKVGKYYHLLTEPHSLQRLEQIQDSHEGLPPLVKSLLPLDMCVRLGLDDHSVQLIDLSNLRLGEEGLKLLWNVLSSNTTVNTLKLANLGMGELQAYRLASVVAMNKKLTQLDLSNNPLTDGGLMALGTSLRVQHNLRGLDLTGVRRVTAKGLISLITTLSTINLEYLILNQIPLTFESALALQNLLEHSSPLRVLCLAQTGLSDVEAKFLAKALKENRTLEILKLEDNRLSDHSAKVLAQYLVNHPTLRELHLGGNKLTKKGAQYLIDMLQTGKIRLARLTFSPGLLTEEMEQRLNQLLDRH